MDDDGEDNGEDDDGWDDILDVDHDAANEDGVDSGDNFVSGRAGTKSRGLAGCEGESKSQSRVQVFRCVYYNYYGHIDPLQLYEISLTSIFQQFNVLSSPMISHSKSA